MDRQLKIKLPFTFVGKLPSFQVVMDGEEECFILDSGAPQMVLNRRYETNLEILQAVKVKGAGGEEKEVFVKNVPSLLWGALALQNQTALLLDLSHMEEKLNTNIRGLIGYASIKEYDILYNYAEKFVTLIPPGASETDEMGLAYPLLFSTHQHIPILPVSIKGKVYNMGIDCGAERNLLDLRCLEPLRDVGAFISEQEDMLIDIANADVKIATGSLGPVSIYDKLCFDVMDFAFCDISHLQTQGGVGLDGIIGYELLSRAKTLLRYVKKEILFAKY